MKYLLMFFTLLVGGLMPVQAVLNTRMGRQTGGPLMGALISFATGFICLIILNSITNYNEITAFRPFRISPIYLWFGGIVGAIFVCYITWVNQQQGVALTFALVVTGQIFLSLLIDHFGLFGSAVKAITLEKIIGSVLIIAGIILLKK